MDPAHPFPFISNLSINLLVVTRYENDDHFFLNRIKMPTGVGVPRFIKIGGGHLYIRFEDLIANNLAALFPGLLIESCSLFRVTRNAITEQNAEKANDLLAVIETALRDRKFAEIVRLEIEPGMNPSHRGMLAAELGLDESRTCSTRQGHHRQARPLRNRLHRPAGAALIRRISPVDHFRLTEDIRNIFHIIREFGSLLLQHPYESFECTVLRFLREASQDPKVLAIKMTLYRTSAD